MQLGTSCHTETALSAGRGVLIWRVLSLFSLTLISGLHRRSHESAPHESCLDTT